jgi:DNA-binding CsgD family transcriptional regulator
MPELDHVERASQAIEAAQTLEELLEITAHAATPFGFAHAALARHVHVQSGLMEPEMVTNYPQAWHDLFARRDYGLTIPLTRIQREYLEEMRKLGLNSGCTIAGHMPDRPTISVHFVVAGGEPLEARPFMLAILLGIAAGQQARTLWQSQLPQVQVTQEERLSPRQVDCIKLVARGMTSWEIAAVLGISDQTVSEYLTDARRRLGVSNRAQLVLKSLKLGYFTLDDVTE